MTEMDKVINEVCDSLRKEREQIMRVANSMRLTLGETPAVRILVCAAGTIGEEEEQLTEAWRKHVQTEFRRSQDALGTMASAVLDKVIK